MKVLKSILILLLVIIVGLIGFTFTINGDYDASATVEMSASPDLVRNTVSDLTTWEEWGAWVKTDPTTKLAYSDPPTGEGAWYTWAGDSIGEGKLTILELTDTEMKTFIEFGGMGSSNGYWKFDPSENGTEVTWGIEGKMPMMGKLFMFLMQGVTDVDASMDEMADKEFVEGLESLKDLTTKLQYASDIEVMETTVESVPYFSITTTMPISDMDSAFFANSYGEIMGYLAEDAGAKMVGMPFAIYHEWNEETEMTTVEVAIANTSEKPETDRIKKGMTHGGNALKAVKTGDFNTKAEHEGLYAYSQLNGKEMIGSPWEVFASDPMEGEIVVEVYYPIH